MTRAISRRRLAALLGTIGAAAFSFVACTDLVAPRGPATGARNGSAGTIELHRVSITPRGSFELPVLVAPATLSATPKYASWSASGKFLLDSAALRPSYMRLPSGASAFIMRPSVGAHDSLAASGGATFDRSPAPGAVKQHQLRQAQIDVTLDDGRKFSVVAVRDARAQNDEPPSSVIILSGGVPVLSFQTQYQKVQGQWVAGSRIVSAYDKKGRQISATRIDASADPSRSKLGKIGAAADAAGRKLAAAMGPEALFAQTTTAPCADALKWATIYAGAAATLDLAAAAADAAALKWSAACLLLIAVPEVGEAVCATAAKKGLEALAADAAAAVADHEAAEKWDAYQKCKEAHPQLECDVVLPTGKLASGVRADRRPAGPGTPVEVRIAHLDGSHKWVYNKLHLTVR